MTNSPWSATLTLAVAGFSLVLALAVGRRLPIRRQLRMRARHPAAGPSRRARRPARPRQRPRRHLPRRLAERRGGPPLDAARTGLPPRGPQPPDPSYRRLPRPPVDRPRVGRAGRPDDGRPG